MCVSLTAPAVTGHTVHTVKICEPCFQIEPKVEEKSDYSSVACIHVFPVSWFLQYMQTVNPITPKMVSLSNLVT